MRFFCSDLHLGHANVIKYCNRPYKDVDEMAQAIITQWNSQVKDGDLVYCLGDMSLNRYRCFEVLPWLNGRKVLCYGNHEHELWSIYPVKEKWKRCKQQYLDAGFSEVHVFRVVQIGGHWCILGHLPPSDPRFMGYDGRFTNWRLDYWDDVWYLGGHLHAKFSKFDRFIDVGFDVALKLFSEDDIINLMEDVRSFIPSRITEWYAQQLPQEKIS